ncbi:U3 snoRNP-associated protein-like YAO [Raphanus sativus]|uniref:U3 snoRNP-associated protein-like YAO isoform X2 n=1 Tax=Raphanus sativus TaxID=3726 RepID=A0A6J0LD83_RAPSA|nr:U3 snoRNP-associated protein-like YAO isoform X2 [Raphanus sativus]KAJ4876475.1 U3 snoRNP-associated protein-like YAO [Raphanus sativus]
MKYPKGGGFKRGGKKGSNDRDPFFEQETKKRRKVGYDDDEDIESIDSDAEENGFAEDKREANEAEDEDEFADETAGEKRKRLAEALLKRTREARRRELEERDDEEDDDDDIVKTLMKKQLEETGRVRRAIASSVQEPVSSDGFRVIVKHRHSVVSVALSDDDARGFSASKDGTILHWDVSSGEREIYKWPSDETLKSHGMKVREPRNKKHSRVTLALAASSDGRYLATGGVDRHVHIWDVRTREHVQAFPGHRNTVSCLCFRHGSTELYSGSFDRSVKAWNVEDRAFVQDSFGHQGEVLAIDALRKDRAISVGRDRTMQLHKMSEQARVVYRAPASSLESCCYISDTEYLSGSDNGTVALWGMLKKKPVFLLKNAHSVVADGITTINENGDDDLVEYNNSCTSSSWVSSVAVCRGSDLAASGAGNGFVHLMAVEASAIRPLFKLPLSGYVNSMAFAKSGKFLIAGVGQETRFGRWGCLKSAQNGVAIHPLRLS